VKFLVVDFKSKMFVIVLTLFYISLVLFISFVGFGMTYPRLDGSFTGVRHNIIPFTTIGTYLFNINSYNLDTWFYNTFGVMLLFFPIGILISILFSKLKKALIVVFILMFSVTIESVQYLTQFGVFDVDDMVLNTVGGVLGIWGFSLYKKRKK
jgi:glycopeptide antibiotics resistance protein